MNVITYDVYKNTVKKHDGFNPVTSEKNYTKLQFRFRDDDDWKNCSMITASFWLSNDNIVKSDVELLSDNLTATFDIPSEFSGIKGTLKVGLQGTYKKDNEEVTIATNIIALNRNTGAIITEGANQVLYEQLLATFNDYLKKIDSEFDNKINVSLEEYLNAHPELTTTVQDGAISEPKLETKLLSKLSYVTPQMYGAKADGINDDTESIQRAIDSGKAVYIPAGTYLTGQININKTVKIYGDGVGKTILKHNDSVLADNAVIYINGADNCVLSDFSVAGGTIDKYNELKEAGTEFTEYNGIELSDSEHTVINNIDVRMCFGKGIVLNESAMGIRLTNIHTSFNVGHGFLNKGYGSVLTNLSTHQNHASGIQILKGGFNATNIRSWGNNYDGVNMDGYNSPMYCVTLTNVEVQQNGRHGLIMSHCHGCIISGYQSTANNYKSGENLYGKSLNSGTSGVLLADNNDNNYINGVVISSYVHWGSVEENSIRISGANNTNNYINLCVNSSLKGMDEYQACFKPYVYTDASGVKHNLTNYNKIEYKALRQKYDNPLNNIFINGVNRVNKAMTDLTLATPSNESYTKKSDNTTNVIAVSSDTSGGLTLGLSDYSDMPVYNIPNTGDIDVTKAGYRRGYSISLNPNNNQVLYLKLTAKVSDYKSFGVFPLIQILCDSKYYYLDFSADYIKSNIIFGTDYVTKNIALNFKKMKDEEVIYDYVGKNITVYLRLCVAKLATPISETATIDVKEFSYKLC